MIVTALMPAPAGTCRFGRAFTKDWDEKGRRAFAVRIEPMAVFAAAHDAEGRSEIRALTYGISGRTR